MFAGTPGFSGYVLEGTGGSPTPGTNDYFPFGPYIAGNGGFNPVPDQFTWTVPGLAGGTAMPFILVNNRPETLGQDYTCNFTTGVITRINPWITGDTVTGGYKKTS